MEQRATALTQARAILDGAYAENRDLNADEQQKYDGFNAEYDSLTAKITREQALADREADVNRSANGGQNPNRGQQPGRTDGQRADVSESAEYRRSLLRYMAYGVQDAGLRTDALAGSELRDILGVSLGGVGATGGVLAPASMERALLDEIKKQNVIRQLADVRSSGSDIEIPFATGHTKAYLVAEGAPFTASKPDFDKKTLKAYKVGALSYITNEAMQDMLSGYLNRYYGDANERLCQTCLKQVERYIAGADGDVVSALRSKLGDWGDMRAEVMARHEAAMALNKTVVAGFKRAGYFSIWKAAPGSCKMCLLMNDQPVTTLTPPLHKGCACTVDKGTSV